MPRGKETAEWRWTEWTPWTPWTMETSAVGGSGSCSRSRLSTGSTPSRCHWSSPHPLVLCRIGSQLLGMNKSKDRKTKTLTVVYDGNCPYCRGWVARLRRLTGDDVVYESFRQPGFFLRFPQLDPRACDSSVQLVGPDGRVWSGVGVIVRLFGTRWWGFWLWLYYLPLVKQLADAVYRFVANRRYRLTGGPCNDDLCIVPDDENHDRLDGSRRSEK